MKRAEISFSLKSFSYEELAEDLETAMKNITEKRVKRVGKICFEILSKQIKASFRNKAFSCGEVHRMASAIGVAEYKVFSFYIGIFKEYLEECGGQGDFTQIIHGFEISEDDKEEISYLLVRYDIMGKRRYEISLDFVLTPEDLLAFKKMGISDEIVIDFVYICKALQMEKLQGIIDSGRNLGNFQPSDNTRGTSLDNT